MLGDIQEKLVEEIKMKNNLLLALTLTTCTSNLAALTKTRTLAQVATTAANYARKNKLKTTGMTPCLVR